MKTIDCPLINQYCDETYNAFAKYMLITKNVSSLIVKNWTRGLDAFNRLLGMQQKLWWL
jgi:hypothetical protein